MSRLDFKEAAPFFNAKKYPPLMCFTHLHTYAQLKKYHLPLPDANSRTIFDPKTFYTFIENWNSEQVIQWIEGIGDCVRPWISNIHKNIVTGQHLLIVDNDYLSRIGIAQVGPRLVICQAIQLLIQNCAELRVENLQMLTMNLRVAAVALSREMMTAQRLRESAHTRTQMVGILNEISKVVSNLDERAKKLIFWLDRNPFDSIQSYIDFRTRVLNLVIQILRMINVAPKSLFAASSEIIKRAFELRDQCDWVMRECDDPLMIATSCLKKVYLRRHDPTTHWGMNLYSSYRGAHVISEIKIGTPADLCGEVDAGDEIIMIDDATVVGWDLAAVAERLGSGADRQVELGILLRKMPIVDPPITTLLREREIPKPKALRVLTSIAPGSLISNFAIDEDDSKHLPDMEPRSPIKRRRSSTFKTALQRFFKNVLPSTSSQSASHQKRTSKSPLAPKKRFSLREIF